MDKKRVAFYVRVSTDAQVNRGTSIVNQRRTLEQNLKYHNERRHDGEAEWKLVETFEDKGRSGKDTDRPGLDRLRAAVRNREVDVVMVTELSRISRSLKDACELCEEFKSANVDFICLRERFDTTDPAGKLFFRIFASIAEFERDRLIERTVAGVLQMRLRGAWFGRGFSAIGNLTRGAEGRMALVPEETAIVKLAFDLYEKLGSLRAVANELNRRGYRTQNFESADTSVTVTREYGNTRWPRATVCTLVSMASRTARCTSSTSSESAGPSTRSVHFRNPRSMVFSISEKRFIFA